MDITLHGPVAALETKMALIRAGQHALHAFEIACMNTALADRTNESARRSLPWLSHALGVSDARSSLIEEMSEASVERIISLDEGNTLRLLWSENIVPSLMPRVKPNQELRDARSLATRLIGESGPLSDAAVSALRSVKSLMKAPEISAEFESIHDSDDDPVTTAAIAYSLGLLWEGLNVIVDTQEQFRIEDGLPASLSIVNNPDYVRDNPFSSILVDHLPALRAEMGLDEDDQRFEP